MQDTPPKFFLRFFRWYCHPRLVDHIEGDLFEVYEERITTLGKRRADVAFMVDVILLFRPSIIRPLTLNPYANNSNMIGSYIKIGWRTLWKSKLYSVLNITGLSFGIGCFFVDRIVRV